MYKHEAGILFMFWKNRQHLSELLTTAKEKTFVAMVMKDRYWHKSPEEMINVSLKYISKIPPGKANTDFINFYQQTNRNLMRYIL